MDVDGPGLRLALRDDELDRGRPLEADANDGAVGHPVSVGRDRDGRGDREHPLPARAGADGLRRARPFLCGGGGDAQEPERGDREHRRPHVVLDGTSPPGP